MLKGLFFLLGFPPLPHLKSIMLLWTAFMPDDNLKRPQCCNFHVVCHSGSKTRWWWLPGISRCFKVWLTGWLFHWFPRRCSWLLQSSQFTAPEQVADLWFPPRRCFRTLLSNEMVSSFVGSFLACNFLLSPDFCSDSFLWRLLQFQWGFFWCARGGWPFWHFSHCTEANGVYEVWG